MVMRRMLRHNAIEAKHCSSKHPLVDPNSKSCRDALGVRPVYAQPYTPPPKHLMILPPEEQTRSIVDILLNMPVGYGGGF